MTEERRAKLIENAKKREAAKRKKINELGLDYDFPSAVRAFLASKIAISVL